MSEQQETEAFVQDLRAAGYGEDEMEGHIAGVRDVRILAGGRHQKGSAGLEILTSAAHKQSQTKRSAHAN